MTSDRDKWNARHRDALDAGDTKVEPVPWLVEHRALLEQRAPGSALDVACGRGRNARFLARLGFEVLAVDVSDVALEALRARDGNGIRTERRDLSADGLPAGTFDVVVDTFFTDRALFGALRTALAPDGVLVFVTFLGSTFGVGPGELPAAFADLEIVAYHEGPPDPGSRPRANLIARAR